MKKRVCKFEVGDEVLGRDKCHSFRGSVVFIDERLRVFVDFPCRRSKFQREFYYEGTMVTRKGCRKLELIKAEGALPLP